jgi:hypothetical protein
VPSFRSQPKELLPQLGIDSSALAVAKQFGVGWLPSVAVVVGFQGIVFALCFQKKPISRDGM